MGVKAIKEKYRIGHIVQKRDNEICIGSPYISDIIVISQEGKLKKQYKNGNYNDGWNTNEDLMRYNEEMKADQATGELKRLVQLKDEPTALLPVFTHEGGRIIKTYCEKYGYPNTTVDGILMYENTHFVTYTMAYRSLKADTSLKYVWETFTGNIRDAFEKMRRAVKYLHRHTRNYLYARLIQPIVSKLKGWA